MADKRAYAKFDIGYLDNPKMLEIIDESAAAVLMHAASILYSAQHLTDGLIVERAMQRKTGGNPSDGDLLVGAGLWHRPGHDCPTCPEVPAGKVLVHDFLEHNRSAVEAKKAASHSGAAARARWQKKADAIEHAEPDADQHAGGDAGEHKKGNAEIVDEQCLEREKEREKDSSFALPLVLGVPEEKKKPETKLPKEWAPTAAHIERAKERGIDLMLQAESFKLHAETHDRRAANWNAAFTTWLIKAPASQRPTGNVPTQYAWANQ